MNLTTLQKTVKDALTGSAFSLSGDAFGAAPNPVDSLFGTLFQNKELKLSAATVDVTTSTPTAKGIMSSKLQKTYSFMDGFDVTAVFSLDAQQSVQLELTCIPPSSKLDNWGLPDMVTGFDKTLAKAFKWSNAKLVFNTAQPAALPAQFPTQYGLPATSDSILNKLKKGMSFQAEIEYAGIEAELKWLLGDQKFQITGPIEWDGELPRMDLGSSALTTLSLEKFSLPIKFHFVSVLFEIPAQGKTPATVTASPIGILEGDIGLPSGGPPITIPFYIEFYTDTPGQVRAVGNFTEASSYGLGEVAKLLGVSSVSSTQSSDFPTLQGLALKTIVLTLLPSKKQLLSASATVSYTPSGGKWEPFGSDLLTFDGLDVTFTAIGPLSKPSLETIIDCKAGLAGGELDAWVSLPELSFGCVLMDGDKNPIDLTEILNQITGDAFNKLTPNFKLTCTELNVYGNKKSNQYRFHAVVKDNWEFDTNGAKFTLSSIGFDISRFAGTPPITTGQVVAQLEVASTPVHISASYQDKQSGWEFSGGTVGKVDIKLTELVGEALSLFGLALPNDTPQVDITNLQMMIKTGNMDFGFSVDGFITLANTEMDIGIELGRTHDDPANPTDATTTFMGYLLVAGQYFEVDFSTGPEDKVFKFEWIDKEGSLGLAELAKAFGFKNAPELPSALNLELTEASFTYDFTKKILILTAETAKKSGAVFIYDTINQSTSFYGFGINIELGVTLADIPLVGSKIPNADSLGIPSAGGWVFSTALSKAEAEAVNALIPNSELPQLPDQDITAKVILAAMLKLGNAGNKPITIPLGSNTPPPQNDPPGNNGSNNNNGDVKPPKVNQQMAFAKALPQEGAPPPAAASSASDDSTKWISIQRSFGIFQFNRIGFRYSDKTLFFVLDAGMSLGPLNLTMNGLSIGSPLTEFKPTFDIKGLGLSYNKPPLEIEGALLKLPSTQLATDVKFQFDGLAVVKAQDFSLSAIGSYAQLTNGDPSLFVFAQLEAPIGGPPAFFITGVMAGFGFNRSLAIPEQNEVQNFPLLKLATPPAPGQNATTQNPETVLQILEGQIPIKEGGQKKEWIKPSPGDYWLGVGLEFTSFELVTSKAILIVEFGHDLVFALLGLSTMQLPQPSESSQTYAYVELQLEAIFKPQDGFFGLSAVLTQNSYVLTPDCHLTGGFAFYIWFGKNTHSGQFVITLGGYHPAFTPPSYFPTEPRLGFNWAVSSKVTIKGGAYFALTPSAIMAGGGLDALFHDGNLKAWFIAYLDVLISWRPFFFTADIGISIGVSYRLNLLVCHKTITISLGASVNVWGPPTGGKVRVHLIFITFTVHFGSQDASGANEALDWSGFSELLPHANNVCTINANSGMYKTLESTESSSGKTWVVRARDFRFSTQSAIPASALKVVKPSVSRGQAAKKARAVANAQTDTENGNFTGQAINVKPMNKTGVNSTHTLTVFKDDQPHDISGWNLEPSKANIPESLWGEPPAKFTQIPAKPSSKVIDGQLVGYDVAAPPPTLGSSQGLVTIKALSSEQLSPPGEAPISGNVKPSPDFVPTADPTSIGEIQNIMGSTEIANRQSIFEALQSAKLFDGDNGSLTRIATNTEHLYSDAPMVQD